MLSVPLPSEREPTSTRELPSIFSVWVPMAWVMASTVTEPRSTDVLSPSPSRLVTTFDVSASMGRSTVANVIEPMATSLPVIV